MKTFCVETSLRKFLVTVTFVEVPEFSDWTFAVDGELSSKVCRRTTRWW